MKILLISPKSPHSFWTFDRTLQVERKKALAPPLGLITVAAMLPRDWETRLVDRNVSPVPDALWDWCDLVMLSGMLVQKEDTLALIRESKTKGKPVAVGGAYATVLTQELLDAGADYVFQGECEGTIPLFIDSLKEAGSPRVFAETAKPDLTLSPVPRFDLLDMSQYMGMTFQTTRGCPFQCEFCDVIKLNGRKPRHKTPEQVVRELDALYDLGWRGEVFVADDNLIGNRDYGLKILKQLTLWNKSHGEPFAFWGQVSVNLGQDPELIDQMTAANFSFIIIGVESTDREALVCTRKFQNTAISLDSAMQTIKRNGLSIMASFVIGLDGEESGAGKRICDFVERNQIPLMMVNPLYASPHTALWERLNRENRLLPEEARPYHYGGQLNYVPTRPEEEIRREYLEATDRLFTPQNYLRRAYRYYLEMRPTRRALGIAEEVPSNGNGASPSTQRRAPLRDLYRLAHLVWTQGVKPPYRSLFWKQLFGILRTNPSRAVGYLNVCGMGENLFQLRKELCERTA